jgi:hypothetical protein
MRAYMWDKMKTGFRTGRLRANEKMAADLAGRAWTSTGAA